jgi:hypothetical protein
MKNKPFYLSDEHTRSFGGKTEGFDSHEEKMFEKKHLKAYLKGKKIFTYGVDATPYEVKEIWTPKNK